jgi:hypothetical protein
LDVFLAPRPWWYVFLEPYEWKPRGEGNNQVILHRLDPRFDSVLKESASIQYPVDCSKTPMMVEKTGGFDSFGNNFYNYHGMHARNYWAIFTPSIIDEHTTDTSFLSKDYCPHIKNKFECAFLPATNCSFPKGIETQRLFRTADPDGVSMTDQESVQLGQQMDAEHNGQRAHVPRGHRTTYWNYPDPKINQHVFDNEAEMFIYGMLFRLNHDFRSQMAHEIHKFKSTLASPFPSGDCVAVHIRRHRDRAPYHLRGEAIREWCKVHKEREDGSCYDDDTKTYVKKGDCIHSYDYGCHTANPYGALTLEHYLNATDIISKSNNVYLRTDDDKYLQEEIKRYHGNKKIFYFPAAHDHRVGSTQSGVSYMSAIQLARECNAFVGHTGSAVTNLFMSNLCIRHYGVTGDCPVMFDFGRMND